MTTAEILSKHGIKLPSTAPGRYYVACPQCSPTRSSAEHRAAKVLGVTIDDRGVCWGCSHCGWTGPEKGSGERRELPAYVYRDGAGTPRFRKIRNAPGRQPRFWLERADGHGGWLKGTKGVDTKIIYRADEVRKVIAEGRIIGVAEGEKDVDSLWALGVAATCNAHGASEPGKVPKWTKAHSEQLAGADLVVLGDNDSAGYEHAETTCKLSLGVAKRVRRLDLAKHWPGMPKGADVSDWLALGHSGDELRALIEAAPDYQPSSPAPDEDPKPAANSTDDAAEIEKLARMPPLDYERQRKDAGKALGISRLALLDALVKAKRTTLGLDADTAGQGRAFEFPEVEPHPEPVAGAELLDDLASTLRRHVVLSDHARDLCALWVLHSYLIRLFPISPKLSIKSPTKGCGKSTLLDCLAHLVARPLLTGSITPAALFRTIEIHHPTLLIDEVDSFVGDNDELRGLLNSSHRHDGAVVRTVGEAFEPRRFSVYTAVALAGIGSLAPTLADRSITVDLQRRLPSESIAQLRVGKTEHLDGLRRRIVRFVADNGERIGEIEPAIPGNIHNRAADNLAPLLAVADAAGGHWPARARAAAVAACTAAEEESRIELLLADVRTAFGERHEMASADLVEALVGIENRPWAEMGRGGKPLSQARLARLFKPLGIAPGNIGPESARLRGYARVHFEEAWGRYLAPEGVSKVHRCTERDETGTSDIFKVHSQSNGCAPSKSKKPNNDGLLGTCAPWKGDAEAKAPPAPSTEPVPPLAPAVSPQTEPADGVPDFLRRCAQCNAPGDARGPVIEHQNGTERVWLHRECRRFYAAAATPLGDLLRTSNGAGSRKPALGPLGDSLDDLS